MKRQLLFTRKAASATDYFLPIFFLSLFFPFLLSAQISNIKKGKLAYDHDIQVETAGDLSAAGRPAAVMGYLLDQHVQYTRVNHDLSTFYFPFKVKDTFYFQEVNPSRPAFAENYHFKENTPNVYTGHTAVVSGYKTIAIDGIQQSGTTFVNLNNNGKYVAYVFAANVSDWEFACQSYFEFSQNTQQEQLVYAACFYNKKLKKQAVKAWLLKDLPVYTSITATALNIIRKSFTLDSAILGNIQPGQEATSSLLKSVDFNTPGALFTFEEEIKDEDHEISSFNIAGGGSLSFFWLDISKIKSDNDAKWLITPGKQINVDQVIAKKKFYRLLENVDNNGLLYTIFTENEYSKKEKQYLVAYDLSKGEKQEVKRIAMEKIYSPDIAVAPDGSYVIVYSELKPEEAFLYDMNTGKLLGRADLPSAKDRKIKMSEGNIYKYRVRFSNDSKKMYIITSHTWGTMIMGRWGNTQGTSVFLTTYSLY